MVREISITKINDIFELRLALELYVSETIAGKLRPTQLEQLQENLNRQQAYASAGDEEGFTKADADFHLLLCQFSGNEEIYQVMLNNQAHLYRFALRVVKRIPNRMDQAWKDHAKLVEALQCGDVELSRRLMKEHLQFGKSTLAN